MADLAYQLVIQFPQSAFRGFEDLVSFEVALTDRLRGGHDVDGHDFGSGWVNFFILTDDPGAAVSELRSGSADLLANPHVRAGARAVHGVDYDSLWPPGDTTPFVIR